MWHCVLCYYPAERGIYLPVSGEKLTARFSSRILPVLSSIPFLTWQTPKSLTITSIPITWCSHHFAKYGKWYSKICPKHNTSYSGQKVNCLATFFCSITFVPCCENDACFGIFVFYTGFLLFTPSIRLVLWSNYVVYPSTVFSYHSH